MGKRKIVPKKQSLPENEAESVPDPRTNKQKQIEKKPKGQGDQKNDPKATKNKRQKKQNTDSDFECSEQEKENKGKRGKRGRPPKQQNPITVQEDPSWPIQQSILTYLQNIGLKHGLVFREEERQKLQKRNEGISWSKQCKWENSEQEKKLISKHAYTIYKFVKWLKSTTTNLRRALDFEHVVGIVLNVSSLMAEECTDEIYSLFGQMFQSLMANKTETIQKFDQKYGTYKFLTGKFTKLRVPYWLQFTKDEDEIRNQFKSMIKNLHSNFKQCFQNTEAVIKYLEEQQLMDNQIEEIREEVLFDY